MKNPNTPKVWDKLLFEKNDVLIKGPFYIKKIKSVIHFLKRNPGKFLDIGIGAGNLERDLIKSKLPIEVYGVDISSKSIKNAKKTLNGKFYVAGVSKLPFKTSFFDTVAVLDVLEHIYEKDLIKALKEINRVTKKHGSLVVSVPLNENLEKLNREGKNYSRHVREYNLYILKKELESAGFVIEESEFIFAFRNFFTIKSIIVKLIPWYRKPNLLIVFCKKK